MNNNMNYRTRKEIDKDKLDILFDACFSDDARTSLAELIPLCKTKQAQEYINAKPNRNKLTNLLLNLDAKTRKNAARLIGELQSKADLPMLKYAFEKESTLFVISSMILALGNFDDSSLIESIEQKVKSVQLAATENDKKHIDEIINSFSKVKSKLSKKSDIDFSGFKNPIELLAVSPENCSSIMLAEAKYKKIDLKYSSQSTATISTIDYTSLYKLRTLSEILIPLGKINSTSENWITKNENILNRFKGIMQSIFSSRPIFYRVDIISNNGFRSDIIKQIASSIDQNSYFVNSPSNYFCELRLVLGDEPAAFAKLYFPKDERFDYRIGSVPASINPVIAANIMQFSYRYLKKNARVIDPCCGSATLLIERSKFNNTAELVGVDRDIQALKIAKKNSLAAKVNIDLIGGNLLTFNPNNKFDELIANLPFGSRVGSKESSSLLHKQLLLRLDDYLKPNGTAILFTTKHLAVLRVCDHLDWKVVAKKQFKTGGLSPWALVLKKVSVND